MANISEDINTIKKAIYGEEVRGSIVNALQLMNTQNNGLVKEVEDKAKALIPYDYTTLIRQMATDKETWQEADTSIRNSVTALDQKLSGEVTRINSSVSDVSNSVTALDRKLSDEDAKIRQTIDENETKRNVEMTLFDSRVSKEEMRNNKLLEVAQYMSPTAYRYKTVNPLIKGKEYIFRLRFQSNHDSYNIQIGAQSDASQMTDSIYTGSVKKNTWFYTPIFVPKTANFAYIRNQEEEEWDCEVYEVLSLGQVKTDLDAEILRQSEFYNTTFVNEYDLVKTDITHKYSLSNGAFVNRDNNTRGATKPFYMSFSKIKVDVLANYYVEFDFYSEPNEASYIGNTGWIRSNTEIVPQGKYFRIVVGGGSDISSVLNSIATIYVQTKIYGALDSLQKRTDPVKDLLDYSESVQSVLKEEGFTTIHTHWEQGSLSGGTESDRNDRVRSGYISLGFYEKIVFSSANGLKYEIDKYDSDKKYTGYLGFTTGERIISNADAQFIRIIVAKTDDSRITPLDADINSLCYPYFNKKLDTIKGLISSDKTEIEWAVGAILSTGEINTNNARLHSGFHRVSNGDIVFSIFDNAKNNTKYYEEIVTYDEFLVPKSFSGWKNDVFKIEEDGYIRLNVRKSDSSAITEQDKQDIKENVFIVHKTENVSNIEYENILKSVNHRGWHEAPENTIPAYVESCKNGFGIVETDVQFTSDNICVCLHDATLNRTGRNTDGSEIVGNVDIATITYAQALQYDMGIYKGIKYSGTKLPKFEDVLKICKSLGLHLYVDFKTSPMLTKQQVESVVDTVNDCGMRGKVTFITGQLAYATWISMKDKFARIGIIYPLSEVYVNYASSVCTGFNSVFMNVLYSNVNSDGIAMAKRYNMPIEIWTVNDTGIIDSMDKYISGVTSDNIIASEYLKQKLMG